MTLKLTLYSLFIFCASMSILHAQCGDIDCGNGHGEIQDDGITFIPIYVNGIVNNNLSDINQGVFGVYLDFKHPNIGETRMYLESPNGTRVQLTGKAITNAPAVSGTRWNICFRPSSIMVENPSGYDAIWDNSNNWGFGTYNGSYWPYNGSLEDFNTGPVNGIWVLIIEDIRLFGVGHISDFSLSFFDEIGLSCTDCLNDGGEISLLKDTLCVGEQMSDDFLTHTFSSLVPDNKFHTNLYEIISGDTVIEIDTVLNLTSYDAGLYTICGLSVFNRDLRDFELENVSISTVELLLADDKICAEITEECVEVYILDALQVDSIKIDLCEGEEYQYKEISYKESGIYYVNESSIYCEEVTILDISKFDTDYAIKSLGTNTLSCNIPIVFLEVVHVQENEEYNSYWYTTNGYINSIIDNNDLVEVNRAGNYHYVWSNGSCTDTLSFEVYSMGDIPIVDIYYDIINCDSINLYFESNKHIDDFDDIEWLLSNGDIVIDEVTAGTNVPGINSIRVVDDDGCDAITNINISKFGIFGSLEFKIDSLKCGVDVVQPVLSSTTIIDSLLWTGDGFESNEWIPSIVNPGLYSVFIYSEEGCDTLLNFEVIESITLENYTIEQEEWNCNSDSVYVNLILDAQDVVIEWKDEDDIIVSFNNDFYAKDTGYYFVSIFIDDCIFEDSLRILDNSIYPSLLDWELDTITCIIDSALLNVNYIGEELSFHWTGPNDFESINNKPFVFNIGAYYLEITNDMGCSIMDTFNVIGSDDIPIITVGDNIIDCIKDSIMIDVLVFGNVQSIMWTGPDGFMSDILNPYVSLEGTYHLVVNEENGCHNSEMIEIIKNGSKLSFILETDTLNCIYDHVDINSNIELSSVFEFEWTGPNYSSTDILNPEDIQEAGWYYLQIVDLDNCHILDSIEVVLDQTYPIAIAGGDRSFICSDLIVLNGTNSVLNNYVDINWTTDGNGTILDEFTLNPTIDEIGTYYLSLIDPKNGCEDSDTILVTKADDISVSIGFDTIVTMGSLISISLQTNESIDNLVEINWTGIEAYTCPNCPEIEFIAKEDIDLIVIIENSSGCTATSSMNIKVVETAHVYFPTIFTPGSENSEGYYLSYKPSINSIEFAQIYDRWGNLLYEGNNYDPISTNFNWDGTFKGKPVDSGVYVVVVKYNLINGESYSEAQTLTLIR